MNLNQFFQRLGQLVKSPQAITSLVMAVATILAADGIITTIQSGAIQAVLTAVLALVAAFGHTAVANKAATKAAEKANPHQ